MLHDNNKLLSLHLSNLNIMNHTNHLTSSGNNTILVNEFGDDVTKFINEGRSKVFRTYRQAYEYNFIRRSYIYEVIMIKTIGNQKIKSHFGYAVPN